jgi:hypothetical protein
MDGSPPISPDGTNRMLVLINTACANHRILYTTMPQDATAKTGSAVPQKRPLDGVREAIKPKHCSIRTEATYIDWIKRHILFHHLSTFHFRVQSKRQWERNEVGSL